MGDGLCGWLVVVLGGLAVIGVGGSRGNGWVMVVGCGSGCGHWCCLTQCLV